MILQSLVRYYEALQRLGKVTSPGWCSAKVSFVLELGGDGCLKRVIPLKQEVPRGKKTAWVPQEIMVPQMVGRSSGVSANFLCDNSSYLLGIDNKGKPERTRECFVSARERHHEILDGAGGTAARAVLRFFDTWQPEEAAVSPALAEDLEEILQGGNLIFEVDGIYAQEDPEVQKAWENRPRVQSEGAQGICLVTGQQTEIARLHGMIKGVAGAQSSGAALVSFNAPSFTSYEKEQSFNAPVGEYAVYAYTTALNYLLSDRKHTTGVGDMTIVSWAEDGEEIYQDAYDCAMEPSADNQEIVDGLFKNLAAHRAVDVEGVEKDLDPNQRFYILGLAPNAARIAVRFFYQDSFGSILRHIREHYARMEIVRPAADTLNYLGIWHLLQETVNRKSRDKKPLPNLAAALYRSIISGAPYPPMLYEAVLTRIRAEQDDADSYSCKITRGRAAIIKAYLLRSGLGEKEELTVALNENSKNVAYTLGREFAVLEAIQEDANPGINATITDRYFNAACATPAAIFPILFKLKNSHIRKLGAGRVIHYERLLMQLQGNLTVADEQAFACPKQLALEEQGMFILGYYHQRQKRFEKKNKGTEAEQTQAPSADDAEA
ncbi:MAG: type I-C CRISPR-associated protein Cas8c/Csd1 [Eubacteriales bacterium]|nr:type I-C CRISPR-associated protein Cas8c/Csd1 [Eubacteriales bacterium]